MKKVSELTGSELDYWVAMAEGMEANIVCDWGFSPSRRWHDGGPIIEQAEITVRPSIVPGNGWVAYIDAGCCFYADAPLTAAMRAYVASKYGQEVVE